MISKPVTLTVFSSDSPFEDIRKRIGKYVFFYDASDVSDFSDIDFSSYREFVSFEIFDEEIQFHDASGNCFSNFAILSIDNT